MMSDQKPHPGDIRQSQIPMVWPTPPPPVPLGLDIDRCITTEIYLGEILVTLTNCRLPTTTTASSDLL